MIKKIVFCICFFLFLLNYSFADTDSSKTLENASNISTSEATKAKGNSFLNDYIVTPITDVALLATAPIGSFVGLFEGASKSQAILYNGEHHSGDSDIVNIFVAPFAVIGFAVGGAIYMTYKLPADLIKGNSHKYK